MTLNTIIIGGTSGIGLEAARYLNKQGYDVTVASRTRFNIEKSIKYLHIDVTKESSVKDFFSLIKYNKIDSIIYAAGVTSSKKSIVEFSVEEYLKTHDVNLLGAILVLKYAFPFLQQSKGKVVIVSSFASRTFSNFSGFEYTISKAGLSSLVKQLAIEWANDGILINTVLPSMVDTPMLRKNVEPNILKNIEKEIPLGRIATPQEIATAIEFLISERNTYITGAGIDINGGQFLSS